MPRKSCCKKKNKMSNICVECRTNVKDNDGVRCQGPCKKWRHYRCLDVSACKIHAIKTGEVVLRCPCPQCEPQAEPSSWRTPCSRGLPCPTEPCRNTSPNTTDEGTHTADPPQYEPERQRSKSNNDRRRQYDDFQDPTRFAEESQPRTVRDREESVSPPEVDYRNNQRSPNLSTKYQTTVSLSEPLPDTSDREVSPVDQQRRTRDSPRDPYLYMRAEENVSRHSPEYSRIEDNTPRTVPESIRPGDTTRNLPEHTTYTRSYNIPPASSKQVSVERYPVTRKASTFSQQNQRPDPRTLRAPQRAQLSTEQLRCSLTELKQGVAILRSKQDAVENCFQSIKQMCEAVDELSKKIDEVCDRVRSTADEQGASTALPRSPSRQGRICFCPNNPETP